MFGFGKEKDKKTLKKEAKEKKAKEKEKAKKGGGNSLYEQYLRLRDLLKNLEEIRSSWWWALPIIAIVTWLTIRQEKARQHQAVISRLNDF